MNFESTVKERPHSRPESRNLAAPSRHQIQELCRQLHPPLAVRETASRNLAKNLRLFMGSDFHVDSGIRYLIESFYNSIREDKPVPIPTAKYC